MSKHNKLTVKRVVELYLKSIKRNITFNRVCKLLKINDKNNSNKRD